MRCKINSYLSVRRDLVIAGVPADLNGDHTPEEEDPYDGPYVKGNRRAVEVEREAVNTNDMKLARDVNGNMDAIEQEYTPIWIGTSQKPVESCISFNNDVAVLSFHPKCLSADSSTLR